MRFLRQDHLPRDLRRQPRRTRPRLLHAVRDLHAALRAGQRDALLGARRVPLRRPEGPEHAARGGPRDDPLPQFLPLAPRGRVRTPHEREGHEDARGCSRVQSV